MTRHVARAAPMSAVFCLIGRAAGAARDESSAPPRTSPTWATGRRRKPNRGYDSIFRPQSFSLI